MPTYSYVCQACGHEFEKMQPISEAPVKTCPSCGKNEVVRKISGGTGVIFKGSGFYKTDYASKNKSEKPKADTKPASSCCAGGSCKH
jgi:putative FmdB family regulatory protein